MSLTAANDWNVHSLFPHFVRSVEYFVRAKKKPEPFKIVSRPFPCNFTFDIQTLSKYANDMSLICCRKRESIKTFRERYVIGSERNIFFITHALATTCQIAQWSLCKLSWWICVAVSNRKFSELFWLCVVHEIFFVVVYIIASIVNYAKEQPIRMDNLCIRCHSICL